jgi:hypothetical protein
VRREHRAQVAHEGAVYRFFDPLNANRLPKCDNIIIMYDYVMILLLLVGNKRVRASPHKDPL